MEFIVVTLAYFGLLVLMIYKGANVPEVLAAAAAFMSAYWGFRPKNSSGHTRKKIESKKESQDD